LAHLFRGQHKRSRQGKRGQFVKQLNRCSQRLQLPGHFWIVCRRRFDQASFGGVHFIVQISGQQFVGELWIARSSHFHSVVNGILLWLFQTPESGTGLPRLMPFFP
jgi:hypothetical protein